MELQDYTTEELRAELKRRALLKAKETREQRKKEDPYIYWEGEIKSIFDKHCTLYQIEFNIESDFFKRTWY